MNDTVKRTPITAPFGTWSAEISKEVVASKSLRLGTLKSDDERLYWIEQRAEEGGRGVIMQWSIEEGLKERLPAPYSARSKVHEYGGGDFCVYDGTIYYVSADDQQIYAISDSQPEDVTPTRITNAPGFRFADLTYDRLNNRLIAVAEIHKQGESNAHALPTNRLVQIGLHGSEAGGMGILAEGGDFYSSPRISPCGKHLVFLSWNLPDMPWQSASLLGGDLSISHFEASILCGGKDGAAYSPYWHNDGKLYFIKDGQDRGQLMVMQDGEAILVQPQKRDVDLLMPQWIFAMESIAGDEEGDLYMAGFKEGGAVILKQGHEACETLPTPARSVAMLNQVNSGNSSNLAAIVTTDEMPATICLINKVTGSLTPIRPKTPQSFKSGTISRGRLLKFKSVGQDCYGLYYPPSHSEYKGPEGALPPAILTVHGGPTGMADRGLKLATQFWTNRGYAVFDVDYSGSTGYGRAYRERLNGGWGQRDVEDLIAAAEYLVKEQLCDPDKLIIQGGSAGGYTCLMALVESDLFKCASVNYPVTDLSQLLAITHKFELGYTYSLTGTTKETAKEELAGRSVLKRASEITAPVIFFQGSEDKVVPPSQPKTLYEALLSKGLVAELYEFEGEGHGFRKAETIIKKLQEEQRFFETCLHLNG